MKHLYSSVLWPALASLLAIADVRAQAPTPADTAKVAAYLALSDKHYSLDNMDSAAWYCLKAGSLSRKLDYKRGFADFVSYYIPVLNRQGEYQQALDLARESVAACEAIGDSSLLALAYNNVGNQHQYLGDLHASARNYLNALIFSEGVDGPGRRLRYSNNLASVFLQLEDKEKSYFYANNSYKLAFEIQDSVGMASSLVNLALSEVLNKKFDEALRHLDQVLALGRVFGDDSYVLDALINKADVHAQRGNYREALALYRQSARVLNNYQVPDYALYVYWGLAQNHFSLGNYAEANNFLQQAIDVATDLQALQELSKLHLLGAEINERTNDHKRALAFRKQYQVLNDSLVGVETRRNIHRLEIEYQTAQKEKEIADQQLVIARNHLEIERKDKSILLWATIATALLSAIVIFIILYRNKQRRNAEAIRLLQKQNELSVLNALIDGEEKERSRLARELHDGVGGILSASKMHLSILQDDERNGPRSADFRNISTLLDQASREIRAIAHNLFPDLLQMHNLDVALRNFCDRIRNSGLNIDYYCLGDGPEIPARLKLVVYRAVQELVNNAMKHARADRVLVQLSQHDGVLSVTVEDDGVGFKDNPTAGIGLMSLKDKVNKLGGRLSIESAPDKGASIHIEFDVSQEAVASFVQESTVQA